MAVKRYDHILLPGSPEDVPYTTTRYPIPKPNIPPRNRATHSNYLKGKLEQAYQEGKSEQAAIHVERQGVYIEFKSDPGADLVIQSLEDMKSKKVRLLNVRKESETHLNEETGEEETVTTTFATVYVANEKKDHFLKKIAEYAQKETVNGEPKNAPLVNSIADIRKALKIYSFWQDLNSLIPQETAEWCEVWLRGDSDQTIEYFENLLNDLEISSKPGIIRFPERIIKVVQVNKSQLEELSTLSDDIAEYRRAKSTAAFWTEQSNQEQAEWVQDLLRRAQFFDDPEVSVCILDTGVNNGHPLLTPVLKDYNRLTIQQEWGTHDHDGHGTLMSGVSAYGDLKEALANQGAITIRHGLESVKILPPPPLSNEPDLWGHVTAQGVSQAEIQQPNNRRSICLAITATDTRDRGRPTSWSGELDQITSGANDGIRRLMIVSAGNSDQSNWGNYPSAQVTDSVHDPAQAWNVLTVGANTRLTNIQEPTLSGYSSIAQEDELSPFSTTSSVWEDKWPIKPEIVLEGGNLARDVSGFCTECEDLSLLSTFKDPQVKHFHPFNMTSVATAQAAWMAAQIQERYSEFWPETIRALLVHSARWPEALLNQFAGSRSKTEMKRLLRICGYGVPDIERALYSASNSLTLIAQSELQPFDKKQKKDGTPTSGYRTKDMHLFDLPWPMDVLQALPDEIPIEMRVTLSYFIEPGPGEIGWKDRYRYPSHGLRFDVKSPSESKDEFTRRINTAVRDEENGRPNTKSASVHWKIGSQARDKGSIHSDIWTGSAAALADSNIIAVYPTIGWWRERAHLGKWGARTRYALIISISTPAEDVDVYTPVTVKLQLPVPIPIDI